MSNFNYNLCLFLSSINLIMVKAAFLEEFLFGVKEIHGLKCGGKTVRKLDDVFTRKRIKSLDDFISSQRFSQR